MSSNKRPLECERERPSLVHTKFKRIKREDELPPADPSSSSEVDSDEDSEWTESAAKKKSPRKASASPRKAPKEVKVASKASILSLASDVVPGSQNASDRPRLADLDSAVLGKIKKALALGGHIGTGEAEAKIAMRLATKLMAQHNVDQADILAAEKDSEKLKRCDAYSVASALTSSNVSPSTKELVNRELTYMALFQTVTIRSTNPRQGVVIHSWSAVAADAMVYFFNCKIYTTRFDDRLDWTFYGLSEQTVAAAYAFEMVYNLVLVWSAQNKAAKGRTGKNNYCHGVARGLYELAKEEQLAEERRVVKKERMRLENARIAEEAERGRARARLQGSGLEEEFNARVKKEVEEENVDTKVKVEGSLEEELNARVKKEVEEENMDRKVKVEEVPDEDLVQNLDGPVQNLDGPVQNLDGPAQNLGGPAHEHTKMDGGDGGGGNDSDSDSDNNNNGVMGFGADNFEDEPEIKADFDGDADLAPMLEDLDNDLKFAHNMDQKDSTSMFGASQANTSLPSVKVEEVDDTPWTSAKQLTLFRQNATSIADDYLKEIKMKLGRGGKCAGPRLDSKQDKEVYKQGKRDARKIDVKRKRIKDVGED